MNKAIIISLLIGATLGIVFLLFSDENVNNEKSIVKIDTTSDIEEESISLVTPMSKLEKKPLENNSSQQLSKDTYLTDIEYHKDEITIFKETSYKHGKKHGIQKEYSEDGKLVLEQEFKDNILDGKSIKYYPNGEVSRITPYIKGLRHGTVEVYRVYDFSGALNHYLMKTMEYKNDLQDGLEKKYRLNGVNKVISEEISYKDGKRTKKAKAYDLEGRLFMTQSPNQFPDGSTLVLYNTSEVPLITMVLIDRKRESSIIGFNPTTKKDYEIHWNYDDEKEPITRGIIKDDGIDIIMTDKEVREYTKSVDTYFEMRK